MAPASPVLALLSASMLATPGLGEKCLHPPPAPQYSNSLYAGRWYEVSVQSSAANDLSAKEKAPFSVIVKTDYETNGSFAALVQSG